MTTSLGRRLGRIFRSGASSVVISVVAVVSAVVVTVGVLEVLAPNRPTQQSDSAINSPRIGSYTHNPVRIRLPDNPDSYLGAYADGVPARYTPIAALGVGAARPNIALYYSGWGEPFQVGFATSAYFHHAVPLVQIEPGRTSLTAIAVGDYDTYLETFATAVAHYGTQTHTGVIIGFAHEPNGPWYRWGYGHARPAIWIAAWRHIVNVFRQQGADDVAWLWTVNIIDTRGGIPSPAAWWPGSSYVTWVGIDGYYYKPSWGFASLFGPTIRAVRALTLDPILISETGAAPAAGKPAKIADLFAGVRAYGLLGFVWFDADRKRDWRLDSPAAIAAFRRGAMALKRPAS